MAIEELLKLACRDSLQLCERWPLHQQIGRQSGGDIIVQDFDLKSKVELEPTLDFNGQLLPSIDRVAPTFTQRTQFAGN